ncbi:hypothetical protein BXZ70DRAFT_10281 [Cristinia sonorae]|uniref:Uncharacterized protein n=1 Tax=Cristinia sonorae TaxID=1940300 RepID=A0A8K0XUN3_9AGAR|nr:hypothetical protein BXZ70DRAFT_10281 [Cristinia sonorae]
MLLYTIACLSVCLSLFVLFPFSLMWHTYRIVDVFVGNGTKRRCLAIVVVSRTHSFLEISPLFMKIEFGHLRFLSRESFSRYPPSAPNVLASFARVALRVEPYADKSRHDPETNSSQQKKPPFSVSYQHDPFLDFWSATTGNVLPPTLRCVSPHTSSPSPSPSPSRNTERPHPPPKFRIRGLEQETRLEH